MRYPVETLLTLTVLALFASNVVLASAFYLLHLAFREYRVNVRCGRDTEKIQNLALQRLASSFDNETFDRVH